MNERLLKIINMAKRGTSNERANAKRIIKNICNKKGLSFEEVMELGDQKKKFEFEYKGKLCRDLVFQIYFNVIGGENVTYNRYYILFECTQEKFEEFKVAFDEYRRIYKKERKVFREKQKREQKLFVRVFVHRHKLYSKPTGKKSQKTRKRKITDQDIRDAEMMCRMSDDMREEPELHKRLCG